VLLAGDTIDRYVIDRPIGHGSCATVYRATHLHLHVPCAIKVLNISSKPMLERLLQEGRIQARMRHRNVVAVQDVVEVDGVLALVMELIEGPTLAEMLRANPRPSLAVVLGVFRGIVRGVQVAHQQGMIHRDLKPTNVLMGREGELVVPKVTDFGIAKAMLEQSMTATRTGVAMGTPQYMAPEQMRDASRVDERADMFSLGAILYELLCGSSPFARADMIATYRAIEEGDFVPTGTAVAGLPPVLAATTDHLLRYDAADRLSSCDALLVLLEDASLPQREPRLSELVGFDLPPSDGRTPAPWSVSNPNSGSDRDEARTSGGAVEVGGAAPLRNGVNASAPLDDDEWSGSGLLSLAPVSLPPHTAAGSAEPTLHPAGNRQLVGLVGLLAALGAGAGVLALSWGGVDEPPAAPAVALEGAALVEPLPAVEPSAPPQAPLEVGSAGTPVAVAKKVVTAATPVTPVAPVAPVVTGAAIAASSTPVTDVAAATPGPSPEADSSGAEGTVVVEGNASQVALVVQGRDVQLPGRVVAGTYPVRAWFGDDSPIDAGKVTVVAGQETRLRCDSFQLRCK
jgi:serine/threonine protein kinase